MISQHTGTAGKTNGGCDDIATYRNSRKELTEVAMISQHTGTQNRNTGNIQEHTKKEGKERKKGRKNNTKRRLCVL